MKLYTVYFGNRITGEGESFSTRSLGVVSRTIGVPYDRLSYHFSRLKKLYYETEKGHVIIRSDDYFKKGLWKK